MPAKHEDAIHTEPLKNRPTKSEYALESTGLAISTLRDIAASSGVPFVADAAQLALSIVNTTLDVKDNKEAFRHLVTDSYQLVYTAADICRRYRERGIELSPDIIMDLKSLVATLSTIRDYAQEKVNRGITQRIIFKRQDLETIRRYRESLQQAMNRFNLQSTIAIRQGVTELELSNTQLLQRLDQGEGSSKLKRKKKKKATSLDTNTAQGSSSAPAFPSATVMPTHYSPTDSLPPSPQWGSSGHQRTISYPMVNPPATIPSNSQGTVQTQTSPLGHYFTPDTAVYNYNSGQTTTTTISNSNNDYSINFNNYGNTNYGQGGY